jgi:hypothetical protein
MKYTTSLLLAVLFASASAYRLRCVPSSDPSEPGFVVPDDHEIINLGPGNFDCCHPPTEEELAMAANAPSIPLEKRGDLYSLGSGNFFRSADVEDLWVSEDPAPAPAAAAPHREVYNVGGGNYLYGPTAEELEADVAAAAKFAAAEEEGQKKVGKVFVA